MEERFKGEGRKRSEKKRCGEERRGEERSGEEKRGEERGKLQFKPNLISLGCNAYASG